jgi:hypothetical protein
MPANVVARRRFGLARRGFGLARGARAGASAVLCLGADRAINAAQTIKLAADATMDGAAAAAVDGAAHAARATA